MGIPRLTSTIKPYGQPSLLNGRAVVIDGPALAYHVISICTHACRPTSPLTQPSYDLLRRTAIAWLDELQAHGVVIAALYFDGHLPLEKRPTRLQRFSRTSRQINNYFLSVPQGVPTPRSWANDEDALPELFSKFAPATTSIELPPPAFAVQAVIDAIFQSDRYGKLSKIVPHEADPYCAAHVRQSGGIVLTSDSDLLVYDLGRQGSVVFLKDIEAGTLDGRDGMVALEYSPTAIGKKLSLPQRYGISSLAFELFSGSSSPKQALRDAAEGAAIAANPDEYGLFMDQYYVEPTLSGDLTAGTDTRISELVLQCYDQALNGTEGIASDPASAAIYLPQLYDDWMRTSSWTPTTRLRQVAYGLVQFITQRPLESISEYKRLVSATFNGHTAAVPSKATTLEECASLITVLSTVQAKISDPVLCLTLLSMYYDVTWAAREGKESVALYVLRKRASADGLLSSFSWCEMHLLAQIQATYYGLRMTKQILDIVLRHTHEPAPAVLTELRNYLSWLPSFVDLLSARRLLDLPARMKTAGALELLGMLAGLKEPVRFRAIRKAKEKKHQLKETQCGSTQRKQVLSHATRNPFAALMDG